MGTDKVTHFKLLAVVDTLEDNCLEIATNWVNEKNVKSIFAKRKISAKKFRDSYSIPIIEYFISVIKQDKEAGNCPIMSTFVKYMLKQAISPQEVFSICMGFRKSLIHFLLQNRVVLKNPLHFMDEVAVLFDANLAGVLDIFTASYAESQKKTEIAKAQKDKLAQILKIINTINTKIIIVQDSQIILVNKPFLDMLGVDNLKIFHEKFQHDFEFLHGIDTYEDVYKQDVLQWIEKICQNKKYFKTNIFHEKISATLSYSGRITKLSIDNSSQYIIALSNISEHIKDEQMLQDYLTHDEITGFKNYSAFESFLITMISQTKEEKEKLFLTVLDIIDLREINNLQGREAGDRIIAEVAEDLRFLVDENIYLSRLEGSRFGVLMKYNSDQNAYGWAVKLYQKIKKRMCKQAISITEVDLLESPNKLFLRAYSLLEQENNSTTVIENDFKNIVSYKELGDQKEFIQCLQKIKSIEMSMYFMELPITAKVKILSTGEENIEIMLSRKQASITETGMLIYFKLPILGNIKATIVKLNKNSNAVSINEFRKDIHSPLNRKSYRVQANDTTKAFITHNNEDYNVKILNLNTKFIAIKIDRRRNLDINSLVSIDISFPCNKSLSFYKTNATITRIDKVPNGYKFVLLCHSSEANDAVLSAYITQQQMQIIKMIKE